MQPGFTPEWSQEVHRLILTGFGMSLISSVTRLSGDGAMGLVTGNEENKNKIKQESDHVPSQGHSILWFGERKNLDFCVWN